MGSATVLVLSALLGSSLAIDVKFPSWFKFGVSTSAYQIEGAWNVSDKAENVWDRFTHADPTVIEDLSNGDVACDSYRQWRRDVDMAAELGVHFYRLSIAWTRILPTGYSNVISADGVDYYNRLIDALLEKGIEPIVTIYHFDLPQNLQDLGGWMNPLIVNWFGSYARVLYSLFGDRVRTWTTINEPIILCDLTYTTGILAPGFVDAKMAPFLCTKHVLLAHARAWRIYDKQFRPLHQGKVSISNNLVWFSALTAKDATLAKLATDFTTGRYTYPIYSKEGGWPPTVQKLMRDVSLKEGYEESRLPNLSKEEIELIRGTYDFFALNYYTCRLVRRAKPGEAVDSLFVQGIPELRAVMEVPPGHPYSVSRFIVLCPKGLRKQMAWLQEQYGDIEVLITESGLSTAGSNLKDNERSDFIRDHLEQVLLSIKVDGVNVTGYTYWSIMDNFEWMDGYEKKFGLYEVDFNSDERTRVPRDSAYYFSSVIRNHALRIDNSYDKYFLK